MIGKALEEDSLRLLLSQNAVRDARVYRSQVRPGHWSLEIRLGGGSSRMIPLRSRREPVRTWASLTAVGRFAESVGLLEFRVEL